ncbi:hypothetical protein HMPREF0352_0287 [Enterococcus faecium TX1330]|nr:hypothetical protein HMPREF0352_0287 [Enterococcus faecium TX1330]
MSSQLYSFVKITTYVTKTERLIHHNNKRKRNPSDWISFSLHKLYLLRQ